MNRTEWMPRTIRREALDGRYLEIERYRNESWSWWLHDPRGYVVDGGFAPSRHAAIVKATRSAYRLGWVTHGAGISPR